MKSVRFLDKELREKLSRVPALKEFIVSREGKTDLSGTEREYAESAFYNSKRLTNLGIFRFYSETYLRQHPYVDTNQTIIMRHRPFEGDGLHMQVYLFAKNTEYIVYENLQSDLVEHLLAIMNEFGLKIFQQPTGEDMQASLQKIIN